MLAQSLEELLPETDQAVVTLESLPASRVLLSQLLSTFQPADLRRLAKLNPASQQRLLNYLNNLAGESAGADSILAILRQRTERVIALLLQPNPRGRKAAFSQRIRWLRNGAAQDSRIGIDAGRLQLSAALQRDAGEKKLHDFVSGVCILQTGRHTLAAGQFAIHSATGLVFAGLWGNASKASAKAGPYRLAPTLKPLHGAAEFGGFRGLSWQLNSPTLSIVAFAASQRLDAKIEGDQLTGLRISGLHVSRTERQGQGRLRQNAVGFAASWRPVSALIVGMNHLALRFSPALRPPLTPRDRFPLTGDRTQIISAFVGLTGAGRNHGLQAELARQSQAGSAWTIAAFLKRPRLRTRLLLWHGARDFNQPYGALPIHRQGITDNQRGMLLSMRRHIGFARISFSLQSWSEYWRTWTRQLPGRFQRVALQLHAGKRVPWRPALRYAYRSSPVAQIVPGGALQRSSIYYIPEGQHRLRFDLSLWRVQLDFETGLTGSSTPSLRTRCRFKLAYKKRFDLKSSFTHHHAGDGALRLYAAEWLMPGVLRLVGYTGSGWVYQFSAAWKYSAFQLSSYFSMSRSRRRNDRHEGGLELKIQLLD